ncbi:MAG: SRPBCC family protein [Myxococcales bacterium]|nr:SRPBCC family protein [Myxococcales bacterium]
MNFVVTTLRPSVKQALRLAALLAASGCVRAPAGSPAPGPLAAAPGPAQSPDGGAARREPSVPTLSAPAAADLEALRPLLARGPAFLARDPDAGPNARITLVARTAASPERLRGVIANPAEYPSFMPILNGVEMISTRGSRQAFRFHVAAPVFDVTALCNLHQVSERRVDVAITQSEAGPGVSRWDFNAEPDGGTLFSLATWGDPSQGHWILRQVARRSPTAVAGMNIAVGSVLALGAMRRAEILSGQSLPVRPSEGVADAGPLAPPPPGPWLWLSHEQAVVSMKLRADGAIEQVTVASYTQAAPDLVLRRLREVSNYPRIWGSFRSVDVQPPAAGEGEDNVRFQSHVQTALTRLDGEQRMRVEGNTVWHEGVSGDFAGSSHRWDIVADPAGGTVVLLTGGSDMNRAGTLTRVLIGMDPWLAVGFAGSWKIVWLRNFLRAV